MNPRFGLLDTCVLVQLCKAGEFAPLRLLSERYGVRVLLPFDVENEFRRKFPQFKTVFNRHYNRYYYELTPGHLAEHDGSLSKVGASAVIAAADSEITKYATVIHDGEAACCGYAAALGTPIITVDASAVQAVRLNGLSLPSTVIRTFDLVVLAHQVGAMTEARCEQFRDALFAEPREALPKCFKITSYAKGVANFQARLVDADCPPVSALSSGSGAAGDALLSLKRVA